VPKKGPGKKLGISRGGGRNEPKKSGSAGKSEQQGRSFYHEYTPSGIKNQFFHILYLIWYSILSFGISGGFLYVV
jgi:hypothetical protein